MEYLKIKDHYFSIRPGKVIVVCANHIFILKSIKILTGTEVNFISQFEFEDRLTNEILEFLK